MIGLYIDAPLTAFKNIHIRDYGKTDYVPSISTCYNFVLSLLGETNIKKYEGVKITPSLLKKGKRSEILKTVWRNKEKGDGAGNGKNNTPIKQEILSEVELIIYINSEEDNMEKNVELVFENNFSNIERFGCLSFGESCYIINDVKIIKNFDQLSDDQEVFLLDDEGTINLPVFCDYKKYAKTTYAQGNLFKIKFPEKEKMPEFRAPM